jgi:ELWxxDGT repeat protein
VPHLAFPRVALVVTTTLALLAPVAVVGTSSATAAVSVPARDAADVPSVDLVADLVPGPGSARPGDVVDLGGTALFSVARGGSATSELWRSDGTVDGTHLVLARDTGRPTVVGDTAFFAAQSDDGDAVPDLWRTDGTAAGTEVVSSSSTSTANGVPSRLTAADDRLFFNRTRVNGADEELWTSDGTSDGTRRVADIRAGIGSSSPRALAGVGSGVWFQASDGVHGAELWRSDGTEAGTVLVADVAQGLDQYGFPRSSNPRDIVSTAGTVFFSASDADGGPWLWSSDGTPAGTERLTDVRVLDHALHRHNVALHNRLLFWAFDEASMGNPVLWVSDGTRAGTRRLSSLIRANYDLTQVVMNGVAYFTARDGAVLELWRSDGTEAGTTRLTALDPTPVRPGDLGGSFPAQLTVVGDRIFFTARDPARGRSLWSTDGTVEGLALVEDLDVAVPTYSGDLVEEVEGLAAVGGDLYLSVTDPAHGSELWSTAAPSADLPKATNDVRPSVAGPARAGTRLVADPGTWSPPAATFAYQWLLDGVDLAGRTESTLPASQSMVGHNVRVRVTASSPGHRSRSMTSKSVPVWIGLVANRSRPQIVGTPRVGSTLTARVGTWSPAGLHYSYRWLLDGRPVEGAHGRTFKLPTRARDHRVQVWVVATKSGWTTGEAFSSPTARVERLNFRLTRLPTIEGRMRVGSTLRMRFGSATPVAHQVRVQWLVDGRSAGTGTTLKLYYRGTRIAVRVTRYRGGYHSLVVLVRAKGVVQRAEGT